MATEVSTWLQPFVPAAGLAVWGLVIFELFVSPQELENDILFDMKPTKDDVIYLDWYNYISINVVLYVHQSLIGYFVSILYAILPEVSMWLQPFVLATGLKVWGLVIFELFVSPQELATGLKVWGLVIFELFVSPQELENDILLDKKPTKDDVIYLDWYNYILTNVVNP